MTQVEFVEALGKAAFVTQEPILEAVVDHRWDIESGLGKLKVDRCP